MFSSSMKGLKYRLTIYAFAPTVISVTVWGHLHLRESWVSNYSKIFIAFLSIHRFDSVKLFEHYNAMIQPEGAIAMTKKEIRLNSKIGQPSEIDDLKLIN